MRAPCRTSSASTVDALEHETARLMATAHAAASGEVVVPLTVLGLEPRLTSGWWWTGHGCCRCRS